MRLELDYYIQIMLLPIYEETAETVSINHPNPPILGDCLKPGDTLRPPAPLLSEHLFLSGLINTIGYTYHTLLELSSTALISWALKKWLVGFLNHKPIFATIAGHPRGTGGDIDNGIGITERGAGWIISGLDMAGYINRIKTGRLNYCTIHLPESARARFQSRALFY
jgi:hypothetical protein